MSHDATKVLLGSVQTSSREITEHEGDPSVFVAGLAIRKKSDDTLSLAKADGKWLGISLGRGLSDSLKTTAIVRDGLGVPILLEGLAAASQVVTITNFANLVAVANDTLKIGATTFTFKAVAATESEVAAATSNDATASALASKINSHSVAGPLFQATAVAAGVTIVAKNSATLGSTIDSIYTDLGTASVGLSVGGATFAGGGAGTPPAYVSAGKKAYISDVSGKAADPASGSTISDATYVSGIRKGIQEDGSEAPCILVDMPGGL